MFLKFLDKRTKEQKMFLKFLDKRTKGRKVLLVLE